MNILILSSISHAHKGHCSIFCEHEKHVILCRQGSKKQFFFSAQTMQLLSSFFIPFGFFSLMFLQIYVETDPILKIVSWCKENKQLSVYSLLILIHVLHNTRITHLLTTYLQHRTLRLIGIFSHGSHSCVGLHKRNHSFIFFRNNMLIFP